MKNYLVITLGTREIQLVKSRLEPNGFEIITEIRKDTPYTYVQPVGRPDLRVSARSSDDFPDFYTISPRTDGRTIGDDNWLFFRPVLDFPLIYPVLQYLKSNTTQIDIIMLVYTDQEQAFEEGRVKKRSYINNDTVFFAEIAEKLIREDEYFTTTEIDKFGRFESVADMAVQYDEFRRIKDDLISNDEVARVYLFPQGGIDQINQALTLRLIETFEGRVIYLQNAEGHAIQELDFPRRFVNVLNQQKIRKHLADYDFSYIDKSLYGDKTVCHLAQYATRRLSMQHNQVKTNIDVLLKDERIERFWPNLNALINTDQNKLEDLYLSVKISIHQHSYLETLHKLYTLNENLFRIKTEERVGRTGGYFDGAYGNTAVNQPWVDKLNSVDSRFVPYMTQKGVKLNNPSRWAYQTITEVILEEQSELPTYQRLIPKLELLVKLRNEVAHRLGGTSLNEINQKLGEDYSLQLLQNDLDLIFDISGFGIYDTIRDEIKSLL
ncbi:hypothetical protein [Spirosoma areae]